MAMKLLFFQILSDAGVLARLLVIALIERLIGVPLITLVWSDRLRTQYGWVFQLILWISLSLMLSWLYLWSLPMSLGYLLLYWMCTSFLGNRRVLMVLVHVAFSLAIMVWSSLPFSIYLLFFVVVQIALATWWTRNETSSR
jgi:phosphatidylglycerophosphate synthase